MRSGRQHTPAFTAAAGDDRTPGAGAHPQSETMHAGSAPVVGLEGPLALGHGVLLVVSGSSVRAIRPHALCNWVGPLGARDWLGLVLLLAGAVPWLSFRRQFGSQPYRRLSGDFLRVLTSVRRVKPGLSQRTTCIGCQPNPRPPGTTQMNLGVMLRNCWQPHRKLLASVSDWSGGRQLSKDGRTTGA